MIPFQLVLICLVVYLLPEGQGKIIEQVYEQCNRPISSRFNLECIGFPKTSTDCLYRRNCDMIAMLTVIPSETGNHFNDQFNITLVGTRLSDASKHEMSLILDAAFKPTYHPGEGTYYNCSWSQKDQTVDQTVKNPGQLVETIGTGIIDDDLLICTWKLDRRSDSWPTDHERRKIDLVTRKIEIILYKDYSRSVILDTRLPIYKSRYLYENCSSPDIKYCLGSPYCVNTHYECHELLTVVQTPSPIPSLPSISLDFNLFSFDYVTNLSYYEVTLYTSDGSPGFQVLCGKHTVEAFYIFPNGTQESVSTLHSSHTHSDPEFDGLRCNWTLPATFTIHGTTFDTRRTKYLVKLRHSPNVYVDKIPLALPGFHIDDSLYTECSSGSLGRSCFGLDIQNPSRDCLRTRDCDAFAIFTVEDDSAWSSTFVEPKLTLDLYASPQTLEPSQKVNMSLSLSELPVNTNAVQTIYKCFYNKNGRRSASIETPYKSRSSGKISQDARPLSYGRFTIEHDWIHCQYIWAPNGLNWPTNNESGIIDLVSKRPWVQLSIGEVKKILPPESVTLPIYKLRYLYQECNNNANDNGKENVCLESDPGCLKRSDCKSLVHMREHSGSEAIDVQILVTSEFDKLELTYTDGEKDNSIRIDCFKERFQPDEESPVTSYYKIGKAASPYQLINSTVQFIKYKDTRSFAMGFSRCFWLQEKQVQLGSMSIDSEVTRYDVKLSVFREDSTIDSFSWKKVALVGYRGKDKQPVPSSSPSLNHVNYWLTIIVAVSLSYHHYYNNHFVSLN